MILIRNKYLRRYLYKKDKTMARFVLSFSILHLNTKKIQEHTNT